MMRAVITTVIVFCGATLSYSDFRMGKQFKTRLNFIYSPFFLFFYTESNHFLKT